MDKADYIHRRKGKYMAQILECFEETIQPHVADKGAIQEFKGLVRRRMNALAIDSVEIIELGEGAINGLAQEIRDRVSPVGRP